MKWNKNYSCRQQSDLRSGEKKIKLLCKVHFKACMFKKDVKFSTADDFHPISAMLFYVNSQHRHIPLGFILSGQRTCQG